jgi:hypothetical protein
MPWKSVIQSDVFVCTRSENDPGGKSQSNRHNSSSTQVETILKQVSQLLF